jgi:hypothetical protein
MAWESNSVSREVCQVWEQWRGLEEQEYPASSDESSLQEHSCSHRNGKSVCQSLIIVQYKDKEMPYNWML